MNTIVVITEPTSTTNITGLRAIRRGSSFLKLAPIAGMRIVRSVRLLRPFRRSRFWICSFISLVQVAGSQLELLEDRTQRQGWEEREGADDHHDADQQADEQGTVGGKRAAAGGGGPPLGRARRPGRGGRSVAE